jgi:hypothetical protein
VTAAAADRPGGSSRLRASVGVVFWLMVVVTLASAFLRLAEGAEVGRLAIDIARGMHRVAASAALVLAIGVAVFGWDRFRPLASSRAVAAGLVALGVALSFLGRFTPSTHPLVALGNPLGGLAMVGLAWWLWCAVAPRAARGRTAIVGWALVAAAFAAVAATVLGSPSLVAGLAIQVLATAGLAAGVTSIHSAGAR